MIYALEKIALVLWGSGSGAGRVAKNCDSGPCPMTAGEERTRGAGICCGAGVKDDSANLGLNTMVPLFTRMEKMREGAGWGWELSSSVLFQPRGC